MHDLRKAPTAVQGLGLKGSGHRISDQMLYGVISGYSAAYYVILSYLLYSGMLNCVILYYMIL